MFDVLANNFLIFVDNVLLSVGFEHTQLEYCSIYSLDTMINCLVLSEAKCGSTWINRRIKHMANMTNTPRNTTS
jgi:hypothetical protein